MKVIFLLSVALNFAYAAGCAKDWKQRVEVDFWYLNHEDQSLSRKLKNGKEEYFYCKDPGASKYICMHESRVKNWESTLYKECK